MPPDPAEGWPCAECFALSQMLFDFADVDFGGVLTVEELFLALEKLREAAGLGAPDEGELRDAVAVAEDAAGAPATTVVWSDTMKSICEEVGADTFKDAVHSVLSEPAPGGLKIVVGPIIGKVTDTTARILVETSDDAELTCTLHPDPDYSASADGEPVALTIELVRGRPGAFAFEGLAPDVHYVATFEGAEVLVDRCAFSTTPEGGWSLASGHKPYFAVISCNKVYTSRALPPDSPACLWRDLENRLRENPTSVHYGLHLGDNVYNDSEWYLVEKGKKQLEGQTCKWGVAIQWATEAGDDADAWATKEEDITELFRTAYRETWGYPPTRYALANMPNLMIFDDHDIRDDWGDREADNDPTTLDHWLGCVAYRVVHEYQDLLRVDNPQDLDCDYHLHSFGDIGFIFVDVRGCKTFHMVADDPSPFLGTPQWRALEDSIVGDGVLAQCKVLLWLMAVPIAYVDPTATMVLGSYMVDDLLGQWSARAHAPEVPRFLRLCTQWRNRVQGREALIIGGDVHEGGWTDIVNQDDPELCIRQLTTSAIANKMTKPHEALCVTCTRDIAGAWNGYGLPGGFSARHYDWTNHRNYAIVDCAAATAGTLTVCVVAAYDLRNADEAYTRLGKDDKSDPFVEVLVGKTKYNTSTIQDDLNPRWDEGPFVFNVAERESGLKLLVRDKDTFSRADFLGSVVIPFRMAPHGEPQALRTSFNCGQGEIEISYTWTPNDIEPDCGAIVGGKLITSDGEKLGHKPRHATGQDAREWYRRISDFADEAGGHMKSAIFGD